MDAAILLHIRDLTDAIRVIMGDMVHGSHCLSFYLSSSSFLVDGGILIPKNKKLMPFLVHKLFVEPLICRMQSEWTRIAKAENGENGEPFYNMVPRGALAGI